MVNPMLVEGQIRGGVLQGIGTALFEEIPYDEAGQPLAGTLALPRCPAPQKCRQSRWVTCTPPRRTPNTA